MRNLTENMTDTDYTYDKEFLINTTAQTDSQVYSQDQTARDISLNVNADKTNSMSFKQGEAIFLKIV